MCARSSFIDDEPGTAQQATNKTGCAKSKETSAEIDQIVI
jgi:hypothetical protein